MKTGVIIQARMGSTRLSGKVMKEIGGKPVLTHVVERIQQTKKVDEIIIATTMHRCDDVIEKEALKCGVKVFRGSEDDVLSRYYFAAKEYHLNVVVRITSDCPLIDPQIVDAIINTFFSNDYEIVSNSGNEYSGRTFPRGLDTEVFSFEALENAYDNADKAYQREHVTPYIYENNNKVFFYKNNINYSKYRWTLDTEEDFSLISKVYARLYHGSHNFYFKELLELFEKEPDLSKINEHIEQKKIK